METEDSRDTRSRAWLLVGVGWPVLAVVFLVGFLVVRAHTGSVGLVLGSYDERLGGWRIREVWNGTAAARAGVHPGDVLLEVARRRVPELAYRDVDDLTHRQEVASWRAWHRWLDRHVSPGERLVFRFALPDGRLFVRRLVVHGTPVRGFFRFGLWSLLVSFVFFFFALFLRLRREDRALSALFRFAVFFATFLLCQSVRSFPSTLVVDRVNWVLSYGVGDLFFFLSSAAVADFVVTFLDRAKKGWLRVASYGLALLACCGYVSRLLHQAAFVVPAGLLLGGYGLLVWAFVRERHVLRRKQLKWLLWGGGVPIGAFVVSYLLWASPFLSFPLRQTRDVQTLASLAFPFAVAMAVQEDRLFDVDLAVRRSLLGSAVLLLAILGYSKLVEVLGGAVAGWVNPSFLLVVVLVVILMLPGQLRVEEFLDRLVGRNRHERRLEVQRSLARLADLEDFQAMGRHVARVLFDQLSLAAVAVYVPGRKGEVFEPVIMGEWEVPPRRLEASMLDRLPAGPVFLERLGQVPGELGRPEPDYLVPLTVASRKVGLLAVRMARRFGGLGGSWSAEILDVLDVAAASAAAAVDRLLYQRLLEQLKEMQAQVIHTGRLSAIGTLAAGLAHELNTPLGYIKANAQLLERKLQPYREELASALNLAADIRQGAEQMHEVVQGLRQFSQVDRPGWAETDLNACVEDSLKMLRRMGSWQVEIRTELGEVPRILAKPAQVNQMVVNLVANACDASPEDGTVWVRTRTEGAWVVLEVEDEGHGIPPEVLDRIFDPFFTTKPAQKGLGLGLSITRTIVEGHGGRIELRNKAGGGVLATVRLPARTDEQDAKEA